MGKMEEMVVKSNLNFLKFDQIVERIERLPSDTILFIIDEKVMSIYNERLNFNELHMTKKVITYLAPEGEEAKSFHHYEKCLEYFLSLNIHRNCHLIAIGGGALSDLAGLVAANILRGIQWSVIPTTLLSMVDASIGGKVAINSKYGKNLIGAFHLPQNIWINVDFLETLSDSEVLNGKGEILKYGILSKDINETILNNSDLEKIINKCSEYKLSVTSKDITEQGKRKFLNLGHTIGHALEKTFGLSHGVAVIWGVIFIFKVFNLSGPLSKCYELLHALQCQVNWDLTFSKSLINQLLDYIGKDKKKSNLDTIELILIDQIGHPYKKRILLNDFKRRLLGVINEWPGKLN